VQFPGFELVIFTNSPGLKRGLFWGRSFQMTSLNFKTRFFSNSCHKSNLSFTNPIFAMDTIQSNLFTYVCYNLKSQVIIKKLNILSLLYVASLNFILLFKQLNIFLCLLLNISCLIS
jgi:hypothetical protein